MTVIRAGTQTENISSPLLPGGNLIAATLNRQLMIWSDRGGASRDIGSRWAVQSTVALMQAIGSDWPVPHAAPYRLIDVIRLDDVPAVSSEANRLQLENPDFLLIGIRDTDAQPVLQAADAKFAADRIKASQVSTEVVENLLAVPEGVTRSLVDQHLAGRALSSPSIVRGVFVVPASELTSYLLRRVAHGRNPTVDLEEVITIVPDPDAMFAGLPQSRAIGSLARIDALPVTPRSNLISAIYYFRVACACFHLWAEQQKPLLSSTPLPDPEPGVVVAEIALRSVDGNSAYELVEAWAADVEPAVRAREAVANVATLPIRMRDVRARVEQAGNDGDNRKLRLVRRELELAFRSRLIETVGDIYADDPRPLSVILDQVAQASRSLAGEMSSLLTATIERTASDPDRPEPADDDA